MGTSLASLTLTFPIRKAHHPPTEHFNTKLDLLDEAEVIKADFKAQIYDAVRLNKLLQDGTDALYAVVNQALRFLEYALECYMTWKESSYLALHPSEEDHDAKPQVPSKKQKFSAKSLWTSFRLGTKKLGSEAASVDPSDEAKTILKDAIRDVKTAMRTLRETSAKRSCINDMGSFYMLAECQRISTTDDQRGKRLTGRFKETGLAMFSLVSQIKNIELALENTKISHRQVVATTKSLYSELGKACDRIIVYLKEHHFDLEGVEHAMYRLEGYGQTLQKLLSSKNPKDLFDGKTVPKNPRSAKGTYAYEILIRDVASVEQYLNERQAKYEQEKQKYNEESKTQPIIEPHLRTIERLGLQEGDLVNTDAVIKVIERPCSEGGLGIPILWRGNDLPSLRTINGGYSSVHSVKLPAASSNVYGHKAHGLVVAVKVMADSGNSSKTLAKANLHFLREADAWSIASSDPRQASGGGQYLARVVGIWNNFQNHRPGLVSVWADLNLRSYIDEMSPSTRGKMELTYKIAQGIDFLHTCDPVIVHGDLKVSNVIMMNGEPRLTDFGVSRRLGKDPNQVKREFTTGSGSYTKGYRAPEVRYSEKSLVRYPTKASDVYAFGGLMFEIITGQGPEEGDEVNSDDEIDLSPIDVKLAKDKDYKFDKEPLVIMTMCFNFHASRRPSMGNVVKGLKLMLDYEDLGSMAE